MNREHNTKQHNTTKTNKTQYNTTQHNTTKHNTKNTKTKQKNNVMQQSIVSSFLLMHKRSRATLQDSYTDIIQSLLQICLNTVFVLSHLLPCLPPLHPHVLLLLHLVPRLLHFLLLLILLPPLQEKVLELQEVNNKLTGQLKENKWVWPRAGDPVQTF